MKNNKILVIALCLMIVLGLTFIVAENNKSPENKSFKIFNKNKNNESNKINKTINNARRANYGFCVSGQTKVRNTCYISEKITYKTCMKDVRLEYKNTNFSDSSVNKTFLKDKIKAESKTCKENYKSGLKECKVAFNTNRLTCQVWRCQSNQTYGNGTCIKTA